MSMHSLLAKYALSKGLQKQVHKLAVKVQAAAQGYAPDDDIEVEDTLLSVNGLPRVTTVVRNVSPESAKHEWGGSRQEAWRPMGRAASQFKG